MRGTGIRKARPVLSAIVTSSRANGLQAMSGRSAFEDTCRRDPSMTRSTRRTTRNSASELPGSGAAGSGSPAAEADLAYSQEDLCPSCNVSLTRDHKDEDSESWVRCDFCKTWYHWRCVGENGQLETIDKWSVLLLPSVMFLILYAFSGSAVPVEPAIVNALSP